MVVHLGIEPSQARCYGIYSPGRVLNGIVDQEITIVEVSAMPQALYRRD